MMKEKFWVMEKNSKWLKKIVNDEENILNNEKNFEMMKKKKI